MNKLIETLNLTKHFGDFSAVENVSISVRESEVLALLGPNGAGKTTTIRMLSSILKPTSGKAVIAGYDVVDHPAQVRRHVGMLTEHHGLYTRMRAHDYLQFFGKIYGLDEEFVTERSNALIDRFGLAEDVGKRLGEYSKGMRQKLALVRTLLHEPSVLLLDEPTSAMDPASAKLVRESIRSIRAANRALIICTHNLVEAEALSDRIAIIQRGRIVAYGSSAQLKQEYLGDPIMELKLAGLLDGSLEKLPNQIELMATGPDWLRYRTSQPEKDNPIVLKAMNDGKLQVVTLTEVGRSLEDVYLQVVGEALEVVPE